MAENGLDEPVIGVTFDGSGLGLDGAIWGGEFLVGGYGGFRRAGHLSYVGLAGGEKAIHEPWRVAAAYLLKSGSRCGVFEKRHAPSTLRTCRTMLRRGINSPMTSSAGRLFDAVASLVGVRDTVSYEGQAAIELEWLASAIGRTEGYPLSISEADSTFVVDVGPMVCAIARDVDRDMDRASIARRFHSSIVEMISNVCEGFEPAVELGKRC